MRRMIPQKDIEKLNIVTNYKPNNEVPEIDLTSGRYDLGQSAVTGQLDEESGVFYAGLLDSATDWDVGSQDQDDLMDYLAGVAAFCDENGDPHVQVITYHSPIVEFNKTGIIIPNLPTTDPEVEGALWNDNGVLKISAGE